MLGGVTGRKSQADCFVTKMRCEFAAIERGRSKRKRKLRVYSEAWPNPELVLRLGLPTSFRSAVAKITVPAGQKVTDEQVAQASPDVILLAWAATGDKA